MSGCTNCRGKSGCDDRKGEMFQRIDDALVRLYPTRTWGEPDDAARFDAGICEHDGQALAEELAEVLDASTLWRPGEPDEYCDYIYVLCVGREPSLVQVRDAGVPLPDEIRDGDVPVRELYLRICLSAMARLAAVQQCAVDLDREGESWIMRETPRAGVYDAPLLPRMQRLVAILPAYGITHLDFGEISAPPAGFAAGEYGALYGGLPDTANYLFYPQPTTTSSAIVLPA